MEQMGTAKEGDAETEAGAMARARLRGFVVHLAAYFVAMGGLFTVNVMRSPENLWSVFAVVAWGAVISVHAAYAMGLFNIFKGGDRPA